MLSNEENSIYVVSKIMWRERICREFLMTEFSSTEMLFFWKNSENQWWICDKRKSVTCQHRFDNVNDEYSMRKMSELYNNMRRRESSIVLFAQSQSMNDAIIKNQLHKI